MIKRTRDEIVEVINKLISNEDSPNNEDYSFEYGFYMALKWMLGDDITDVNSMCDVFLPNNKIGE